MAGSQQQLPTVCLYFVANRSFVRFFGALLSV